MKIEVQIISMQGTMEEFSGARDVPDKTTASDLVGLLGLPFEETYALMINNMPVAIPDRPSRVIEENDRVTIFPPIKGG